MNTYIKINETEYPATISGMSLDRSWGDRASKSITLAMDYATAAELFVDGLEWSIVQRETYPVYGEDGEATGETQETVEEFDNSEYCVAGAITDNRDGTMTVKMGKSTELETVTAQLAELEAAYDETEA